MKNFYVEQKKYPFLLLVTLTLILSFSCRAENTSSKETIGVAGFYKLLNQAMENIDKSTHLAKNPNEKIKSFHMLEWCNSNNEMENMLCSSFISTFVSGFIMGSFALENLRKENNTIPATDLSACVPENPPLSDEELVMDFRNFINKNKSYLNKSFSYSMFIMLITKYPCKK